MMMSENPPYQSQVHVTAFVVLRVKRKKVGLNKQLDTSYCRGGGGLVLTQHLIT
jgi:hypothetical protein